MSPLLRADDGVNTVIRPLCYVPEADIQDFVTLMNIPVFDMACPGRFEKNMKRMVIKQLLSDLEKRYPGLKASLLQAVSCIDGRHLMDKRLWKS